MTKKRPEQHEQDEPDAPEQDGVPESHEDRAEVDAASEVDASEVDSEVDASEVDAASERGEAAPPTGAPALLAAKVAALEDRIKRMQADFLNDTRRIRTQADTDSQYAIQRVVVDLLPVADALHGAAAAFAGDPQAARFKEGIDLVTRQFDEVLARHGVTRIDAVGKLFDPSQHEAVLLVDRPDLPPQTVVEVVRPGFALAGRIVRAAHVMVSRVPPSPSGGTPSA